MRADALAEVRRGLHERLLRRVDADELARVSRAERRVRVREEALQILRDEGHILPQGALTRVVNDVSDAVVGLGPIEFLLKDPEITEVMVNGPDDVYVERKGRIEKVVGRLFEGEEAVFHVIERIVAPLGLRVDGSSPWVDARLPDGSRVHAIVPPLSLCGPVLNVRKFAAVGITPQALVANGTLGPRMLGFLSACVRGRANIVISGGTSSGKTTLLGVLTSFVPTGERIVTIEDAAELRIAKPHVIGLESRPPNVEGRGEVTVRDLVRNALRMRPDRIVVGEVRGGEALDMLQAMNTGHDGSLSTAHANSARHLLWRLETMALMSDVVLPVEHVRKQVGAAVDVVVHMARLRDGRRVVFEVATVDGVRDGEPVLTGVFGFVPRLGTGGRFMCSGQEPELAATLRARGEHVPEAWFASGPDLATSAEGVRRWRLRSRPSWPPVRSCSRVSRAVPSAGVPCWPPSVSPVRSRRGTSPSGGGRRREVLSTGSRAGERPDARTCSRVSSPTRSRRSRPVHVRACPCRRRSRSRPSRCRSRWVARSGQSSTGHGSGSPLEEALDGWVAAITVPDVRLVAGVLRLHRRAGGALAPVLEGLARTLRERRAAVREVRSLTAQARLSGAILGLLPIGFFGFLWLTSSRDMAIAVGSPLGRTAIAGGLVLQAAAFVWIRRLLRVEP